MQLIPVVDVMGGVVVRAVRGERASYRPIESALCRSIDPVEVAQRLVAHCAARIVYVADLDALRGGLPQRGVVRSLCAALPGVTVWLDGGFATASAAATACDDLATVAPSPLAGRAPASCAPVVPVYASESLASPAALAECCRREGAVLALDRRGAERLDRAGAWDTPSLWPPQVVVMTLERVGSSAGPDVVTIAALQSRSPATRLYGAGGIRDERDLALAARAGAAGWLVASALHDGAVPARGA